ncbi:VOC family protein [Nocardioides sp. zg-DK7169]|uniref:VOC family protein n=1 Tax=Nocardioides sp. zg-DK7169 TaxID=2736600 RepID=UPI001554A1E9|nr:VOC family protein [Nocardioides sp. zg-DK7169]NPC97606.1 hypothetical protein [Nocardioides sp. zg-DK7169]
MSLQFLQEVVVASADVPAATRFHREAFDLEVLEEADGSVLLGVPGAPAGRLRLVPASSAPSEDAPEVWDLGARLLGIYSRDLDATAAAMARAGGAPRRPVTYPYGEASLSELVGRGPDGVWWTIPLAVTGAHRPSAAYDADAVRRHSELHTAVLVVADHEAAVAFFEAAGFSTLFDGAMTGAPFDDLVGMPADAALRLAFMVGPEHQPARLEIMSFTGVPTRDRSADPVGIRRLVLVSDDPEATRAAMVGAGAEVLEGGILRGPVGVEIEVVAEGAR